MELKTEQTQWKWWNGKIIQFTDPFFKKALLISWIYILIEFKLCSNATRSTNTGWVLQHTFHSRTLYIPFSFISLCFVYSFTLIQFARTCESVRKRQQTTLAIRDALIAIALLSFHANFPNMFAMRMREWEGGNEEEEGGGRSERIFAILLLFRFTFYGLAGKFWLRSCDPNTFNTITIWNTTDNDAPSIPRTVHDLFIGGTPWHTPAYDGDRPKIDLQ